ncbi:MAG: hypothetical protein NVS9B1_25200 [Candidatus Dormibacteraceae bacterium]
MGKKRAQVRQVKKTMKQVRPKAAPAGQPAAASGQQRRQRERYVESGGFLQGYAPDTVLRLGYFGLAAVVVSLLIMVELILGPLAPHGLAVRIVAAVAWVIPIVILVSLVAPGVRLAWKDRKEQPRMVQGQLLGASSVSTSRGLGMIMVRTRGGTEQYLCQPGKLIKVPGNVVPVVLSVTPNLRHVRTVSVMGQRQMARPEPPVPEVLNRLQLLPIVTPAAIVLAVVLGDDITAFIPFTPEWAHAIAAFVVGAALGAGAFGLSYLYQKRLMAEAQALVPGGLQ